jgi:hypothetical protein
VFVKNGDGTEDSLPKTLGDRLLLFAKEKLPYEPILKFWERLRKNPSYDAVQRLFDCLDFNHHPLMTDGRFLCWRKVRRHEDGNLYDIYTGKVRNNPGDKPRMKRNQVDEDKDKTCSFGYHGSSFLYAQKHYGTSTDELIEVAVDPEDVVAIPRDYNNMKIRICGYEVLKECEEEDKSELYNYNSEEDDDLCPDCDKTLENCECDFDEEDDICPDCGDQWDSCSCCEKEGY